MRNEPVFMKIVATSWAGMSVYIERRTARSSTCLAISENTSLTSMPDLPCWLNLKLEPIATPLRSGNSWPSRWLSSGFGSQVST